MAASLLLRRTLLLLCAGLLLILSISYRSGHVGPDDFVDAQQTQNIAPGGWQMLDSADWARLAQQANSSGNQQQAQDYALHALSIDPTSGEAAAQLISILSSQNKPAEAAQFASLAGRLWTAKSSPHSYLAAYWRQQGKLDKVLAEWDILLTRNPSIRSPLFPHLQELAVDPKSTHFFDQYAQQPPLWWAGFFGQLVRDKQTPTELLTRLYALRLKATEPLQDSESAPYVARLITEKRWTESHDAWLAGLPEEWRSLDGLVYDGGFEGERHNTGFDWFFTKNGQINIQQSNTFGMDGKRALRISFNNSKHVNFQHLWQRLVLKPADYSLTFRFRADGLRSNKGLQWRIYCIDNNQALAESTPLEQGHSLWSNSAVDFTIPPDNCPAQMLRLEASSRYAHDQVFDGNLWLDSIAISRKTASE